MPATFDERVIGGLPRHLFETKGGDTRRRRLLATELSDHEVRQVLAIRDQLLHLYAPARYADDKAQVWIGVNSQFSFETGSEHWRETKPKEKTLRWRQDIPYLVVDDPDDPQWMPSLQGWCDHISGFTSLLPRWEENDGLTSVLIDIDHPGPSIGLMEEGDLLGLIWPLVVGIESIEAQSGVQLPVEFMWTGNTGIWVHLHMTRSVSHRMAAEFALLLGSRRVYKTPDEHWGGGDESRRYGQPAKFNVCVREELLNQAGDPDRWRPLFRPAPKSRKPRGVRATIDGGNVVVRPCRMPLGSHQRTLNPAIFLTRDGRVIDDQVGHLMSIRRQDVDLEAIVETCRPSSVVATGGVRSTTRRRLGDRAAGPSSGVTGADDLAADLTTTQVVSNVTSVPGVLPRHPVPGTCGQWIILLDDVLGAEHLQITGTEDLGEILHPFSDGPHIGTYHALIVSGGLLRVYDWMAKAGREVTEDAVVALAMSRYRGSEPRRDREIRRMVRSDVRSGIPEMLAWSRRRSLALHATEVSATAGITSETTTRVLQGIICKSDGDGIAPTTMRELARIIGLVPVDCIDGKRLSGEAVKVSRAIKDLIGRGLLTKLSDGDMRDGTPSVYRVEIGDEPNQH